MPVKSNEEKRIMESLIENLAVVVRAPVGKQEGPERLEANFNLSINGCPVVPPINVYGDGESMQVSGRDVSMIASRVRTFRASWGAVYFCVSSNGDATLDLPVLTVKYRRLRSGEEILEED